jgi:ABC-type sugar transport system ATPase subunit
VAQLDSYALELSQIDKRFGEVHANKYIDLKVHKGTIHGIVGEHYLRVLSRRQWRDESEW